MLKNPFPNTGKTLVKEKFFILDANKNIILNNTSGTIIKLVFKVAVKSNLLVIATQTINKNITKKTSVIG